MSTTIQISEDLQKTLTKKKLFERETYEEVIWDLVEDSMELSRETKESIQMSRKEYEKGEVKTLDEVREELGL